MTLAGGQMPGRRGDARHRGCHTRTSGERFSLSNRDFQKRRPAFGGDATAVLWTELCARSSQGAVVDWLLTGLAWVADLLA